MNMNSQKVEGCLSINMCQQITKTSK